MKTSSNYEFWKNLISFIKNNKTFDNLLFFNTIPYHIINEVLNV